MAHKAGFVNILGKPNAGKSTLMNVLVGERLSIITSKAQTTRHRIMGIVNSDDFQIVYSDTPGILKPHYKLHESMMRFVTSALQDADVILFVVDIREGDTVDEEFLKKLNGFGEKVMVLLNKIDLVQQHDLEAVNTKWKELLPKAVVIPISALNGFNTKYVFDRIVDMLPEGPPFFDKDQLTDKSERFFVAEIVREKILKFYQEEIPYSSEVVVQTFKDEPDIVKIHADIIVERETQKGIIIGHQGKALKKVGTEARKDIEQFLGKKVYLELIVKVDKDWRNRESQLRRYGYESN